MLASSTQLLRVKKQAKKEEKKREKVTNKNERKRVWGEGCTSKLFA